MSPPIQPGSSNLWAHGGMISLGVRGWFPSNYCEVVTRPENGHQNGDAPGEPDDADGESEADDDFDDLDESDEMDSDGNRDASPGLPLEGAENREQEEAAYWIPQATPDGRLFYFNTLTGVSTMELPLETPTSATETGPRDRSNVNVPEQTRPPPEMLASGYERDEDDTDYEEGNSASEREGESILLAAQDATAVGTRDCPPNSTSANHAAQRNGKPAHATGQSPTTSFDSVGGMSPLDKTRNGATDFYAQSQNMTMGAVQAAASMPAMGTTTTSFTTNPVGQLPPASVSRSFFDDGSAVPLTWTRLVENMQLGVERYRQAINNSNRSEYVRRAEDISDHLRLLLAAGSGTTDNHSGNPSIISTNKALYPHFRDMMSKFSKLVLSSHIAAADWPTADSYAKCLQEADGVLSGVYGYVEVARQQRGEEIPRLIPGFTMGSYSGGNWQGNGLGSRDTAPFMDQDDDVYIEPTARLDTDLLMKLDDLKKVVVASIRRLDDQLTLHDKIISTQRHEMISDAVCTNATKVLEGFQPWLAMVESINLAPLGAKNPNIHISLNNPQLIDFSAQKQRLYDLISDLMISCQAVAGPLGDEWSELRSDPLEDRLKDVRISAKQLETCTSQLILSLQHLLEMMPHEDEILRNAVRHHANGGPVRTPNQLRQDTSRPSTRNGPPVDIPLSPGAFADEVDNIPEHYRKGENSKVHKFFGEVPAPMQPVRTSDETPNFLKLDHENEISYDTKVTPPQLRGGTLRGLVEQLTRHDKLDSGFNHTFLLTYRSFTSAAELFDLLVQRFTIQPPGGISNQDLQMWVERKQKPIRLRVVNILKTWFDTYWMEGQDEISKSLIRKVFAFAKDSVATTNTAGAQPLMAVLEQRMLGQETTAKRLVLTLNTTTPAPIMPKNMKKLKFLDIDVTEFARQLTIIESRLYGKIKPTECLNKTWQRKLDDGSEPAVNVKALILHSNQLTNWVAELILTQNYVKRRVAVIKHFVSVADVCHLFPLTKPPLTPHPSLLFLLSCLRARS